MNCRQVKLPALIFLMCKNGACIAGGAAKYIIGVSNKIRDYDLIVPPDKWHIISTLIPKNAKLNKHGGLKFKDDHDNIIDVWPCSIEQHLRQCKPGMGRQEYVLDYVNSKVFTSFIIGTDE